MTPNRAGATFQSVLQIMQMFSGGREVLFGSFEPLQDLLFLFIGVGQFVLVKQVADLPYNLNALCTRMQKGRTVWSED
jgi:hypothetical protein